MKVAVCGWNRRGGGGREVKFHREGIAYLRVQTEQLWCFPESAPKSFLVDLGSVSRYGCSYQVWVIKGLVCQGR